MSKDLFHIQCTLTNGMTHQISWIPEKYAKEGKFLKLKNFGEWTDGWEVVSCGLKKLSADIVDREHDYKRMKDVTDI